MWNANSSRYDPRTDVHVYLAPALICRICESVITFFVPPFLPSLSSRWWCVLGSRMEFSVQPYITFISLDRVQVCNNLPYRRLTTGLHTTVIPPLCNSIKAKQVTQIIYPPLFYQTRVFGCPENGVLWLPSKSLYHILPTGK